MSTEAPDALTPLVAEAAQRQWRSAGEASEIRPWTDLVSHLRNRMMHGEALTAAAVIVPSKNHIECVLDANDNWSDAVEEFRDLIGAGYSVSALLPVACMGAGHEAFRGLALELQGWWLEEAAGIKFTHPELA